MLDAVGLERRGVPTVTLAHDLFESFARAQARSAQLPDLPIVVTPRPRAGIDVDEMLARDPTLVDRVVAAFEQRLARVR